MGRIAFQKSAGGVLVDGGRVLLIHTRTRGGQVVWTFPKGRIEPGESYWEAALREIREETGYYARLKRRLRTTTYVFQVDRTRVRKTVYWFLVEPVRKVGRPNPREVIETRWFALTEASRHLAYRSDKGLLNVVRELLASDSVS